MIRFLSTAYTPSTMPLSTAWASASRRRSVVVRSMRLRRDRKSTRLNSSHLVISYAVFCLKKKSDVHGSRLLGLLRCLHVSADPDRQPGQRRGLAEREIPTLPTAGPRDAHLHSGARGRLR